MKTKLIFTLFISFFSVLNFSQDADLEPVKDSITKVEGKRFTVGFDVLNTAVSFF
jgi:hypothetical protein